MKSSDQDLKSILRRKKKKYSLLREIYRIFHMEYAKTKLGTFFLGFLLIFAGIGFLYYGFFPDASLFSTFGNKTRHTNDTTSYNISKPKADVFSNTFKNESTNGNDSDFATPTIYYISINNESASKINIFPQLETPTTNSTTNRVKKLMLTFGYTATLLGLFCFVVSLLMFKNIPRLYKKVKTKDVSPKAKAKK